MSYRETRNFVEKMRALGYPNLVSMESFRTPNFDLVADILVWLIKSYDPNIEIPTDISTEQDRVIFIKAVATVMAPKAHIKLNTKKLYTADMFAIKELLKIANVLYDASTKKFTDDDDASTEPAIDLNSRLSSLKSCRALASDITLGGANIFDLLGQELELREIRSAVLARPFELANIDKDIKDSVGGLHENLMQLKSGLENLQSDETNLQAKIEKRQQELDRAEKRLKSLQGVRPAYMDEYERIEAELTKLYAEYIEKFRNMAYLEQQVDEYDRMERDRIEESESTLKKMQNQLREEELRLLRNEKELGGGKGVKKAVRIEDEEDGEFVGRNTGRQQMDEINISTSQSALTDDRMGSTSPEFNRSSRPGRKAVNFQEEPEEFNMDDIRNEEDGVEGDDDESMDSMDDDEEEIIDHGDDGSDNDF